MTERGRGRGEKDGITRGEMKMLERRKKGSNLFLFSFSARVV